MIPPRRARFALLASLWLGGCGADPTAPGTTGTGSLDGGAGGAPGPGIYPTIPTVDCGRADLRAAQPAVLVDGVAAVPVDIDALEVSFVFDLAARTAKADAELTFTTGGAAGNPVLDLRQTPNGPLDLDGAAVDPSLFPITDFGGGPDAELRRLLVDLPACSDHVLRVSYDLDTPRSPCQEGLAWDPSAARLRWNFSLTDYVAGCYLEKWAPANLIHDRHSITFDLLLTGAETPHRVISNGTVEELSPGDHFRVTFPATSNAMSPMLVVLPADEIVSHEEEVALPGGSLTVSLHKPVGYTADLPALAAEVGEAASTFTDDTGPYAHGQRFTALLVSHGGMEYDGAALATPGVLVHELFHSWYGRGIRPARGADGWIDEAWNEYNTGLNRAFESEPLDMSAPPLVLCNDNPWARDFPMTAYGGGAAVFAGLAAVMGMDLLRQLMADFYQAHVLEGVTTEALEDHLAVHSGHDAEVRAIFRRFVFGAG